MNSPKSGLKDVSDFSNPEEVLKAVNLGNMKTGKQKREEKEKREAKLTVMSPSRDECQRLNIKKPVAGSMLSKLA